MAKKLQIPIADELMFSLKQNASDKGMTLTGYITKILERTTPKRPQPPREQAQ